MSGSVQDAPREGSDPGVVAARAAHVRAFEQARVARDVEAMAAAALGLAATYAFGAEHGRVPAYLYEAWSLAGGEQRARLAVALARVWGWAGDASRATGFASEALAAAETLGDDQLLAQALDAQLLAHWGPDDLAVRREITARLEDTAAHVADVETRLSAHLWRLTTALETLDLPAVRRQLRALELLAEESGSARVRFFAASRRAMAALLTGDLAAAAAATTEAVAAGAQAGEVDTYAIERTLTADLARQAGDAAALTREAATFEAFGLRESVTSVAAQGAVLWVAAGRPQRALPLVHQLAGPDLAGIPRDVDWLLTVTALTEVAVALGEEALVAAAVPLLEPCAGRGVVNAGGVSFAGVVDDYLAAACRLLGREDQAARWAASAATAYRRLGATWWLRRLEVAVAPASVSASAGEHRAVVVAHLRAGEDGIWWVGREGAVAPVREAKGLRYLHHLLARPGVDVPALALSDAVAGHPGSGVDQQATGELVDRRALQAYRNRLAELEEELEEAHAWADEGRVGAVVAEREALLAQLRSATGLGGRARESGATAEKARVAVRKAVAAAIDRVAAVDASLGRLLRDTISTGRACRYEPDPDRPVRWVLQ